MAISLTVVPLLGTGISGAIAITSIIGAAIDITIS